MTLEVLDADGFKAFYVNGLGDMVKSADPEVQREFRRSLGKLLDSRARGIAQDHGLEPGEQYSPYDAVLDEGAGVTYVDFKLVNEARKTEYKGWSLTMHFSDNEYRFAKKEGLVFMAYRIVPNTSIAELLLTFEFAEAKDKGFVQLEHHNDDVWWSIDLLQVEPNLRWKLGLRE